MPTEPVFERIARWLANSPDQSADPLLELKAYLEYLAEGVFQQYQPTKGTGPSFWARCRNWLDGADSEGDQRLLLRLLGEVAFIPIEEFYSLYRTALREQVASWLVRLLGLSFDDPSLGQQLEVAIRRTWFCGITDSLDIAAFYHVNRISGTNHRPQWRYLADTQADSAALVALMAGNRFDRLVLLEDFVGSGNQVEATLQYACSLPSAPPIPVLAVPLICAPKGAEKGRAVARAIPHFSFAPVVELAPKACVTDPAAPDEPSGFGDFRDLATRLRPKVPGIHAPYEQRLGYEGTGALVVLHSNCPDNTVSLVHHNLPAWQPVFPRSRRT